MIQTAKLTLVKLPVFRRATDRGVPRPHKLTAEFQLAFLNCQLLFHFGLFLLNDGLGEDGLRVASQADLRIGRPYILHHAGRPTAITVLW